MNIIPVEGPRIPVSGVTGSLPLEAARRSYDQSACRFGSLTKTRSLTASTATLWSVGYGSETTRVGGTSPPAMCADAQSGHACAAGAGVGSSRQPLSRSSASSRESATRDRRAGRPGRGGSESDERHPATPYSTQPARARRRRLGIPESIQTASVKSSLVWSDLSRGTGVVARAADGGLGIHYLLDLIARQRHPARRLNGLTFDVGRARVRVCRPCRTRTCSEPRARRPK